MPVQERSEILVAKFEIMTDFFFSGVFLKVMILQIEKIII
jgi:hypothetical protein